MKNELPQSQIIDNFRRRLNSYYGSDFIIRVDYYFEQLKSIDYLVQLGVKLDTPMEKSRNNIIHSRTIQ